MPKTAANPVDVQLEQLRQYVIAARKSPDVAAEADECLDRLRALHAKDPAQFTPENVRWVNVLRGQLGLRVAAHNPGGPYARKPKRKGDTLDHCWRCETPVDERFVDICPACDTKAFHWRICPVCQACGCQRAGGALV